MGVTQHLNYCHCMDCGYLARGGKFPSMPVYEHNEISDPYCPRCNSQRITASSKEEVIKIALISPDIEGFLNLEADA